MKKLLILPLLPLVITSCTTKIKFTNNTRAGGYAMGENITLKFTFKPTEKAPDRILVNILETKTGSMYTLNVPKGKCGEVCEYTTKWQGKKPDGSWPAGGKYLVYAMIGASQLVYSDTVEFGLAD